MGILAKMRMVNMNISKKGLQKLYSREMRSFSKRKKVRVPEKSTVQADGNKISDRPTSNRLPPGTELIIRMLLLPNRFWMMLHKKYLTLELRRIKLIVLSI